MFLSETEYMQDKIGRRDILYSIKLKSFISHLYNPVNTNKYRKAIHNREKSIVWINKL